MDCINNDGATCDRFMEEDCVYTADVTFHPEIGSIADYSHCQELCITLEPCQYWVYKADTFDCILYNDFRASCASVSGPMAPIIELCPGIFSEIISIILKNSEL